MLFWSFIILIVIGIVCFIIYENTMFDDEWIFDMGVAIEVAGWVAVLVSIIIFTVNYTGLDGYIEENKARYESLTYQYENELYDNDNDIFKKWCPSYDSETDDEYFSEAYKQFRNYVLKTFNEII